MADDVWEMCDYCGSTLTNLAQLIPTGMDDEWHVPVVEVWCGACPRPASDEEAGAALATILIEKMAKRTQKSMEAQ